MCDKGCTGDCGCDIVVAPEGEKGDPGETTFLIADMVVQNIPNGSPVDIGTPLQICEYTVPVGGSGTYLVDLTVNVNGGESGIDVTTQLYVNNSAQSSNINFSHRTNLTAGGLITHTHKAKVGPLSSGNIISFYITGGSGDTLVKAAMEVIRKTD